MLCRSLLFVCAWVVGKAGAAEAPEGGATLPRATAAAESRGLSAAAERELRTDILPFWLEHARDRQHGGFYGRIDGDMTIFPDAPRGTLLTSRILWTFSAAYRRYKQPEYLAMADWAFKDWMDRGWDSRYGGLFWTVAADGSPVETAKHVYGQAFGIYSLAEYYRATGQKPALDRAIDLYRLIETKARDRQHGGYFEAFSRDWTRNDAVQRILGGAAPKSQNTHIHILEAYTNLLRVWPDPQLRDDLRALFELMLTRIIDPRSHHLVLYFQPDWTPASDPISYGHDIELSWLIVEAAQVLGDPTLVARAKATALVMAQNTLAQGVDRDGGLFNEAGPRGLTDSNKDWWPQAEAVVGFLNAYEIAGDPRYLAAARRTWDFIETRCIDRKNGDWYESVSRDGTPRKRDKLSVWKCPYHNSRACLEVIERVEALARRRPE